MKSLYHSNALCRSNTRTVGPLNPLHLIPTQLIDSRHQRTNSFHVILVKVDSCWILFKKWTHFNRFCHFQMPIEGHKFRIVVITQGADDVILVDEAGVVHEIPVMKIADDQVPFFSFIYPLRWWPVSILLTNQFIRNNVDETKRCYQRFIYFTLSGSFNYWQGTTIPIFRCVYKCANKIGALLQHIYLNVPLFYSSENIEIKCHVNRHFTRVYLLKVTRLP